jgi:hypothetical protein
VHRCEFLSRWVYEDNLEGGKCIQDESNTKRKHSAAECATLGFDFDWLTNDCFDSGFIMPEQR